MGILSAEEKFVSDWFINGLHDDRTVETFVQSLLSALAGHRHRSLDGVISVWRHKAANSLEMQGVAITVDDQFANPIELSLLFASDKRLNRGSRVSFGLTGKPIIYGSPAHNKIVNHLLAGFPARFAWRYSFIRDQDRWVLRIA